MSAICESGRRVLRWSELRGENHWERDGRCRLDDYSARIALRRTQTSRAGWRLRRLVLADAVHAHSGGQGESRDAALVVVKPKSGHLLSLHVRHGFAATTLARTRMMLFRLLSLRVATGMFFRQHSLRQRRSGVRAERSGKHTAPSAHKKRKQGNADT